MNTISKLVLCAGLDKEEFEALRPAAREENAKNLRTYALVAVLVFAVLVVVNALVGDFTSINQTHYLLMLVANLIIWFGTYYLVPKHPGLTLPLAYTFMASLYAFSLAITVIHPELPAVTTIVLLFAVPFVMCDRPLRLAVMTAAAVAALGIVSFAFKPNPVAQDDLWNGVSFGAIAMLVETLQQRNKYRILSQSRHIQYLSETDLLTKARNRNRFENCQGQYAADCNTNLVCLYTDVNGLHELNNTKGHHAGDVMLQTVAGKLIERFGQEHTYRIGGDEFLCFIKDTSEEAVRGIAAAISGELNALGYHISLGIASAEKSVLNMQAITSTAENEMYQDKRRYYQQEGVDRRRR